MDLGSLIAGAVIVLVSIFIGFVMGAMTHGSQSPKEDKKRIDV